MLGIGRMEQRWEGAFQSEYRVGKGQIRPERDWIGGAGLRGILTLIPGLPALYRGA